MTSELLEQTTKSQAGNQAVGFLSYRLLFLKNETIFRRERGTINCEKYQNEISKRVTEGELKQKEKSDRDTDISAAQKNGGKRVKQMA